MGMTQGLLAALVADEAPQNLRATAFGVFNFVSGIALLLASLIAGTLWDIVGPFCDLHGRRSVYGERARGNRIVSTEIALLAN
jgi:MFS family permease